MISRRLVVGGGLMLAMPGSIVAAPRRWPREVLAFYYPWYGTPATSGRWFHWQGPMNEAPRQSPTLDHPALGFYDSHDRSIVETHAREAKSAGITALIVSWWGPGSFEDKALPGILDALHDQGLKATIYFEQQKDGQPGADRDVAYVTKTYGNHPAWLKVDGRPVMFVYLQALRELSASGWRQAASAAMARGGANAARPFLIGDVSPRETEKFQEWAPSMDGIHVYVLAPYLRGMTVPQMAAWADRTYPAWKRMVGDKLFCATVIPGFDDTLVPDRPAPRPTIPRHDGMTYQALWDAAIRHDADWVLVTSFNEWHEGSEIEPSREYGTHYLEMTAANAHRFLRG